MKLKLILQVIAYTTGRIVNGLINWLDRSCPLPALPPADKPQSLTSGQQEQLQVAEITATSIVNNDHCQIFDIPDRFIGYEDVPLWAMTTEIVELPAIPEVTELGDVPSTPAANLSRGELVQSLLDEAWSQGLRTYAQLMKYVELQTGTACSKKVVSAWKKSRFPEMVAA